MKRTRSDDSLTQSDGSIVLDVGGVRHKTTRSTLATGSGYFEARLNFDGKEEDGGALFVDRDGELFHYVLTHLRNNGLPRSVTDRLPADARARLVVEAEYYAMPALIEQLVVPPVGAAVRLRATDGPNRMPGLKPSTTMVFGKIAEYDPGQHKRAKFPTSKAPISAIFHSFRLIFGRAIISRNNLEAWMFFP